MAKPSEPFGRQAFRAHQGEQIAPRRRPHGGHVGKVHTQRLLRDMLRRIVGQKMHIFHQGILGEHKLHAGGRFEEGGVVREFQRAGMTGS